MWSLAIITITKSFVVIAKQFLCMSLALERTRGGVASKRYSDALPFRSSALPAPRLLVNRPPIVAVVPPADSHSPTNSRLQY